jgi:hypothetical protein
MNKRNITLFIVFVLIAMLNSAGAKLLPGSTVFQLQLQKSLYVSGEKVWFKNTMISEHSNIHQTILYVDLCGEGLVINSCIVKRENNHWQGDLLIPDSLETGVYLIRAYTGNYDGKPAIESKLITVINRFGNNKTNELRKLEPGNQPLDQIHFLSGNSGSMLKISGTHNQFDANKPIDLIVETGMAHFPAGASLAVHKVPDIGLEYCAESNFEKWVVSSNNSQVRIFNKLTLCGMVIDRKNNEPVEGEMVLFSISDSVPHINYAHTDLNGEFLFEVDGYYGVQNVIVQTLSKEKQYEIILYPNLLEAPMRIPFFIPEAIETSDFVTLSVKRSFVNSAYFTDDILVQSNPAFRYPFYGTPSTVVIPDRYVDLVDFEEISKELLPLCRIKKRGAHVGLTIYNVDQVLDFENPWVIIDGVPVFDVKFLLPLGSRDIKKIEVQPQVRCFGGLYIDGALSVITREGNFTKQQLPVNAIRKRFETFHLQQRYPNREATRELVSPDFRDVLFWSPGLDINTAEKRVTIQASGEKGNYVAILQAINDEGAVQRSVFHFTIK